MLYLAENLKKYRVMKNLTQEDVADYLKITPQSVSKWERGETYPDITLLPALVRTLPLKLQSAPKLSSHPGRPSTPSASSE